MGLDMYAYSAPSVAYSDEVDFKISPDYNVSEFAYWRKHNALHGWMQQLYIAKGGCDQEFNCSNVNITEADLTALETALNDESLPETNGFFFGADSRDRDCEDDVAFIEDARQALADGRKVFYSAWY